MQYLRKMINFFNKSYFEKWKITFLAINIILLMVRLIIKLNKATNNVIKKKRSKLAMNTNKQAKKIELKDFYLIFDLILIYR